MNKLGEFRVEAAVQHDDDHVRQSHTTLQGKTLHQSVFPTLARDPLALVLYRMRNAQVQR